MFGSALKVSFARSRYGLDCVIVSAHVDAFGQLDDGHREDEQHKRQQHTAQRQIAPSTPAIDLVIRRALQGIPGLPAHDSTGQASMPSPTPPIDASTSSSTKCRNRYTIEKPKKRFSTRNVSAAEAASSRRQIASAPWISRAFNARATMK